MRGDPALVLAIAGCCKPGMQRVMTEVSIRKASITMNKSLPIVAMLVVLTSSASAQEAAELVQTTGYGELRRASENMITPNGKSISISLPATVKTGEIISIKYGGQDNAVTDSFMVTGITIKDSTCAIENKRNTLTTSALSDMIFTQQCKKLK